MTKVEELANWLETGEVEEIDLKESAEMLREQEKTIKLLEIEINTLCKCLDDAITELLKAKSK